MRIIIVLKEGLVFGWMELDRLGAEEVVDCFTTKEVFEKVGDGLAGIVGWPVLVFKPEVVARSCDGEGEKDTYGEGVSLGVLSGIPEYEKNGRGVVLPMGEYVYSCDYFENMGKREGAISFNCSDVKNVDIVTGAVNKSVSSIRIFGGAKAVESCFCRDTAVNYYRAVNFLGNVTSLNFRNVHNEEIKKGKSEAIDEFAKIVKEDMVSHFKDVGKIEGARRFVSEWGLSSEVLELCPGVSVDVNKYLESRG